MVRALYFFVLFFAGPFVLQGCGGDHMAMQTSDSLGWEPFVQGLTPRSAPLEPRVPGPVLGHQCGIYDAGGVVGHGEL